MLGWAALLQLFFPVQQERTRKPRERNSWRCRSTVRDAEPGLGKNYDKKKATKKPTKGIGGTAKNTEMSGKLFVLISRSWLHFKQNRRYSKWEGVSNNVQTCVLQWNSLLLLLYVPVRRSSKLIQFCETLCCPRMHKKELQPKVGAMP